MRRVAMVIRARAARVIGEVFRRRVISEPARQLRIRILLRQRTQMMPTRLLGLHPTSLAPNGLEHSTSETKTKWRLSWGRSLRGVLIMFN